jgi:hypothetical protein
METDVYLSDKETRCFHSAMASLSTSGAELTENQWFYRRWWWLMLGVTILSSSTLFLAIHKPQGATTLLITAPLLLGVLAALWLMKLTVRVDAFGIHYQYIPFLNRWRHWPWSELQQVFPRTYSPLGDYGGWGIRGLPGNLAYNVWGPSGLQLVFLSGKKLLLGTQQPTELQLVLAALQAADSTRPIMLPTT